MKYGSRNVLADDEMRRVIKEFSQWPTIPQVGSVNVPTLFDTLVVYGLKFWIGIQVYVKGEFLGGSDILKQMHENGELKPMLEKFKNADGSQV